MKTSPIPLPVIIAAILLLLIVAGEALVYTGGHGDYSSSVDGTECTLEVRGSHVYDIVVMDGSFDLPDRVYIYHDEDYQSTPQSSKVAVGARALDEDNYVKELQSSLKVRGVSDSQVVDAKDLKDIVGKSGSGTAVVCISGALPDTVYDGTSSSPIMDWLESGGRLYWAGNVMGKYISHPGSLEPVAGGTSLFLGSECIDDLQTESYDKITYNGFCESFSILNNEVQYGVKTSSLPSGSRYVDFGYTDGERSSICVVDVGDGCVCIIGGSYSDLQRIDMSQMVCSGISPDTSIIQSYEGKASGHTSVKIAEGEHVYVYLGGDLAIYGQLHRVIG